MAIGPAVFGAAKAIGAFFAASAPVIAAGSGAVLAGQSLFGSSAKAPEAAPTIKPPDPGVSLAKAQEEATKRLRMVAQSGGQTVFGGSAGINPDNLKLKTLLG